MISSLAITEEFVLVLVDCNPIKPYLNNVTAWTFLNLSLSFTSLQALPFSFTSTLPTPDYRISYLSRSLAVVVCVSIPPAPSRFLLVLLLPLLSSSNGTLLSSSNGTLSELVPPACLPSKNVDLTSSFRVTLPFLSFRAFASPLLLLRKAPI